MTRDERERELAHMLDRLPDLGPSLPLVLEEIGGPEVGAFARGFLFGRESGRAERPAPAPAPRGPAPAPVAARDVIFDPPSAPPSASNTSARPPAARPAGPWELSCGELIRAYAPEGVDLAAVVHPDLSWEVFPPLPAIHATHDGRAESLDAAKAAVDAILGPPPGPAPEAAPAPAPAPRGPAPAPVNARDVVFDPAARPAGPWECVCGEWSRAYDTEGEDLAAIVRADLSWAVFAPNPRSLPIQTGRAKDLDAAKAAVDAILGAGGLEKDLDAAKAAVDAILGPPPGPAW